MQDKNKSLWGVVLALAFMLFLRFVPRIPEHRKILGNTIRKYRKGAKLSQEKLAEKADLHPVYLGKVERGEKWISLHALIRVADALKIRVRDLLADL
jgi:DNA-binding XRE family transcriptional regulator